MEKEYLKLNPDDEVTITVSLGDLAKVYAVMGSVNGSEHKRSLWSHAKEILDPSGEKYFSAKYDDRATWFHLLPVMEVIDYSSIQDSWDNLIFPKKEVEWYHSIPESGVLCWLSDTEDGKKDYLGVVTRYHGKTYDHFVFENFTSSLWKFAKPLTKEEVDKLTLGEDV